MCLKEIIDIEALLVRAYRQYQVDRVTPERVLGLMPPSAGGSNFAIVAMHMAYGTFIDTSPAGANIIASAKDAAAVPDELLAVHDAVLALDDYFIERSGDVCMVWDRETAANASVEIFEQDREWFARAKRWGQDEPEPLLRRLARVSTSILVILHARNATRPFVDELIVDRMRPVYRGSRKEAAEQEAVYVTSPETIAVQRAEYQTWHCALDLLAAQLAGLESFRVSGPGAPLSPWDANVIHRAKPLSLEAVSAACDGG